MEYINNVFTLGMLKNPADASCVRFVHLSKKDAACWVQKGVWHSVVGHEDTAAITSKELGAVIPFNRQTLLIEKGDEVLVTQYIGPRLPEGSTQLPDGAKFEYFLVLIRDIF
ncbi:STIV orfB116 family protein [Pectobacterium sp. CFBP8739]|uniref:STIV orfB116 family protein n=1 Tax=Pectobacterium sp. CFBP8739 TaxID=2748908 RepID=UPI0015DFE575|nr:DUF1874 domain-containing protein [Pectobacterium sp. CFBP8739]MBA0167851.1 DUF1874 domain-containing protein [Pectobacterium sp. CFBP8739]